MKKLITMMLVLLLSGFIATPVLAKKAQSQDRVTRADDYAKASTAEKKQMRAATLEEAARVKTKREEARKHVDKMMQERMKNIQADSPGNIGPIGGR